MICRGCLLFTLAYAKARITALGFLDNTVNKTNAGYLGVLSPRSQCLSVPKLMPKFEANSV